MSGPQVTTQFDETGFQKLDAALRGVDKRLAQMERSAERAAKAAEKTESNTGRLKDQLELAGKTMGILAGAGVAGALIGQLGAITSGLVSATKAGFDFARLGAIANDTAASWSKLGDTSKDLARFKDLTANAVDETSLQRLRLLADDVRATKTEFEGAARMAAVLTARFPETGTVAENLSKIVAGEAEELRKLGVVIDKTSPRYKGLSEAGQKLATIQDVASRATQFAGEKLESQTLTLDALKTSYDNALSTAQGFFAETVLGAESFDDLQESMGTLWQTVLDNKDAFADLAELGLSAANATAKALNITLAKTIGFIEKFSPENVKGTAGDVLQGTKMQQLERQLALDRIAKDPNDPLANAYFDRQAEKREEPGALDYFRDQAAVIAIGDQRARDQAVFDKAVKEEQRKKERAALLAKQGSGPKAKKPRSTPLGALEKTFGGEASALENILLGQEAGFGRREGGLGGSGGLFDRDEGAVFDRRIKAVGDSLQTQADGLRDSWTEIGSAIELAVDGPIAAFEQSLANTKSLTDSITNTFATSFVSGLSAAIAGAEDFRSTMAKTMSGLLSSLSAAFMQWGIAEFALSTGNLVAGIGAAVAMGAAAAAIGSFSSRGGAKGSSRGGGTSIARREEMKAKRDKKQETQQKVIVELRDRSRPFMRFALGGLNELARRDTGASLDGRLVGVGNRTW